MMPVALQLGGTIYRGWQRVQISRGLDQVSGEFSLRLTERWSDDNTRRPIRLGEQCAVRLGEETVITGHVDSISPSYDAHTHTISIRGRDATGDLVDCAVLPAGKRWKNQTVGRIARDICAPFGIPVVVDTDVGAPLRDHAAEPGERAFDVLDRAARYRGLLLTADGLGSLVITRPGRQSVPTRLVLGQNIRAATGSASFLERFREYLVVAQLSREEGTSAEQAAGARGRAVDATIGRYRPTVLVAEDQADAAGCQSRAEYQRSVAAGRGNEITYTVDGWTHAGGLWQPNVLVPVQDHWMGIDARWLLTRVSSIQDEQGQRSELTVMPPSAYDLRAIPEPEQEAWQ